jgi:hypothetical protein
MGIDKQPNGSFKVTIMIDRKRIYLGYFTSYARAVDAYNDGKKESKNNTGRKIKQAQ